MFRVKMRDLYILVDRINELTNNPKETYIKTKNKLEAQIGNYHLSGAYGGWQLQQIVNVGGGVKTHLNTGFGTKKELYLAMQNYINGIYEGKNNEQ